jgi:hypothetical protein
MGQKPSASLNYNKVHKYSVYHKSIAPRRSRLSFFHYEKIRRLKKSPQLPGAGRTRTWHHHGSDTATFPRSILVHSSLEGIIDL